MMNLSTAKIIFAGGGTGGHLFPAIAIADRVKELVTGRMTVEIIFVGTRRGIEYRLKETLGYPLHVINMRGIARSLTLKNLLVPFIVIGALVKSYLLLGRFHPNLVVGTGGYVCWPVLRAASYRGVRTLLQEQNSFPGVSTRQLAGRAKKIYLGFAKAAEYMKTDAELIVTGNPVRHNINAGDRERSIHQYGLDPNKKTILVLGGSQGARAVNRAILDSLKKNHLSDKYQILWQTGKRDYTDVAAAAGNKENGCSLFPFAQEMNQVYAAADLVIARAGALTLAEIAACELPAILIPYPYAAGDHQKKNAADFVARSMAVMIEENRLPETDLLAEAVALLESDQYRAMKQALARENEGKQPAVDVIAVDIIKQLEEIKANEAGN